MPAPAAGFGGLQLGAAIGLLGGLFLGWLLSKVFGGGREARLAAALKAPAVGIVYDSDEDAIDVVPLWPLGKETFYTFDPRRPLIVFKTGDAVPLNFKPLRKPAYMLVAKRIHAFAVNPSSLAKIGLARLVLRIRGWEAADSAREGVREILHQLARQQEEVTGEVQVNPDVRIGLVVKIPEVIKAVAGLVSSVAVASIVGIRDMLETVDKLGEHIKEYYRYQVAIKGFWTKAIAIGGAILLILLTLWLALGGAKP